MPDSPALPAKPFDPYLPTADVPFDARWQAHLLRRTAFGMTAERLETYRGKSPSEMLDGLFNYDAAKDPLNHLIDELEGYMTPFAKADACQQWWVYRMLRTPQPFQERVALFWHNRFATSIGKVENPMYMHKQIETFRLMGLGNYRDLLLAVGRDPAMLVWLDGMHNRKGKANENYARELMELFTLGIGNYTEKDVQQIARAFTGWTIRSDIATGVFDPKLFDDGEKEIFGKTGKFDSEAVIDLILQHPAAPKYLASKMLKEFVHPHPPQEAIDHFASRLLDTKWEIKPVLREMLASRMFFSEWAYRSKIKGPIELVIGSELALSSPGMGGKPSVDYALKSMTSMGQAPMLPPSVKGWDGEELWINANTLLVRYNFGLAVATQRGKEFTKKNDVKTFLEKRELTTTEKIVDHFATVLLDNHISPEQRATYVSYLDRDAKGKTAPFVFNADSVQSRVRDLIHLMMATPEYQLS